MVKKIVTVVCILVLIAAYVTKKTNHVTQALEKSAPPVTRAQASVPAAETQRLTPVAMTVTNAGKKADMTITHGAVSPGMKNYKKISSSQ